MAPKHKNPSSKKRTAVAPYNFIPLPNTVVEADIPPDHDNYTNLSGHFVVRLTTQSPTYIRSLLTTDEFRYQEEEKNIDGLETTKTVDGKKVKLETPFRKLVKNKPNFFNYAGEDQPIIPGSSLRGMLRSLFEIVTYSKIQPVSDALKIYFRAVAADSSDPLSKLYKKDVIGNNARNVHVGYLEYDSKSWYVRPAKTPKQIDKKLSSDRYLKIRKDSIKNGSIEMLVRGYRGLDDKNYRPQYYKVTFEIGRILYFNKEGEEKRPISANKIGMVNDKLSHNGSLVTTGNMLETSDGKLASPRMNVYLVPEASSAKRIKLSEQAVDDYLTALTPFQKEEPFNSNDGTLQEERPIFYIPPRKNGGEIIYFGHTPNFRIQHLIEDDGKMRTVTPRDFVPNELKAEDKLDFAEVVFGYSRSNDYRQRKGLKQGDKQAGYGSRVFVTDAKLTGKQSNIFFISEGDNTLVPKILASPKPTSFQLYLTQPQDKKAKLKHYGSQPVNETVVRGHKLYWHRGLVTKKDLEPEADDPGMEDGMVKEISTQHTQIKPLRPDLTFEFKVYFDNLTKVELGALAWTLSLPENHCHKIGMGKSLGMGAVLLHNIDLYIEDRKLRYQTLFAKSAWAQPLLPEAKTIEQYQREFEKHILSQPTLNEVDFRSLPRIERLLLMLRWWQRDDRWLSETRYMKIKHESEQNDNYTERTILPDPIGVVSNASPTPNNLHLPPSHQFQKREGEFMTGSVAYFPKRSGGITPDKGGDKVHVHIRDLPTGIKKLKIGQRVRFIAVREGDKLQAYEIELIED